MSALVKPLAFKASSLHVSLSLLGPFMNRKLMPSPLNCSATFKICVKIAWRSLRRFTPFIKVNGAAIVWNCQH